MGPRTIIVGRDSGSKARVEIRIGSATVSTTPWNGQLPPLLRRAAFAADSDPRRLLAYVCVTWSLDSPMRDAEPWRSLVEEARIGRARMPLAAVRIQLEAAALGRSFQMEQPPSAANLVSPLDQSTLGTEFDVFAPRLVDGVNEYQR